MSKDYSLDALWQQTAGALAWDRASRMRLALEAYSDNLPRPLRVRPDQPDDNLQTNYIRSIVERTVSFLLADGPSIEIGGPDDDRGEEYLARVWPEDERAETLYDAATNGALFGHVFLRFSIEGGIPRVIVVDPMSIEVEWDPQDYTRVTRYIRQWSALTAQGAEAFRESVERTATGWTITLAQAQGTTWRVIERAEWRYQVPPIIHCKNLPAPNEFWGAPDITRGILRLNHYINRVDSLINRILRLHSYPKTIAIGVEESDLRIGVDGVIFLPDASQKIQNLEMQSDLSAALAFRDRLLQQLARLSGIPDLGNDESVGTQVSGVALKMRYKTLLDRTRTKRALYGRLIRQAVVGLLEIGGLFDLARPEMVTLHWPEALPVNDREMVDIALEKRQLGYSMDTLIRQTGGDPALEAEKRRLEQEEQQSAFDAGRL